MDIAQIRQQYPQYDSMTDGELAFRLWNKDYKGKLPMGQFADRIKLPQGSFQQMTQFAESTGYTPTAETGQQAPTEMGALRSAFQGATFGFGDEIVGGLASGINRLKPGEQGSIRQSITDQERARIGQYREESPLTAIGTEIAGAVSSPAALVRAPAAISALSPTARAAATGGAAGAAYGAGTEEGGVAQRARNAVEVAIPSALFGAVGQGVINVAGRGANRLKKAFDRASQRPTIENLRTAKNAAYQAVDDSGLSFAKNDIQNIANQSRRSAADYNYVDDPAVFPQTYASLRILDRAAERGDLTIGQLDSLRQTLWSRYNTSKGSEPAIMEMIDSIDTLIQQHPSTDGLMQAARAANSRYKKTELLDNAMQVAERQTAATGSGGNILNKYKQAVNSIMSNPNKAKWFNEDELSQMDKFVRGTVGEDTLRLIGKLSPSGNGLMAALNVGAAAVNPGMLAVSGAAIGAKALADRGGAQGMQELLDRVATGAARPAPQYAPMVPVGGASVIGQTQRENR